MAGSFSDISAPWGRLNRRRLVYAFLIFVILLYFIFITDDFTLLWLLPPYVTVESRMIACYDNDSSNRLLVLNESLVPRTQSIFFLETYCHDEQFDLNARQSCAIESAAMLNPNSHVYLLVPSPVRRLSSSVRLESLLSYPNVYIRHVNMKRYMEDTPMSSWYNAGRLKSSRWPQSHASDLLRYVTLWKFGGTYVDLDVVLLKPFNGLTNFTGAESDTNVAAGLISITHGHPLNDMALENLFYNFRGYDWGNNGPGVITRILKKYCGVRQISKMVKGKCKGFQVMPPEAIYPIRWQDWKDYFTEDEKKAEAVRKKLSHSLAIHVWNHHSSSVNATVGSKQPYVYFASKFCPRIYSTLIDVF